MDDEGEFANDELRQLSNHFGNNIKRTAGCTLWANGLNKSNDATTDTMIGKMLEDSPTLDEILTLSYAVSVRN